MKNIETDGANSHYNLNKNDGGREMKTMTKILILSVVGVFLLAGSSMADTMSYLKVKSYLPNGTDGALDLTIDDNDVNDGAAALGEIKFDSEDYFPPDGDFDNFSWNLEAGTYNDTPVVHLTSILYGGPGTIDVEYTVWGFEENVNPGYYFEATNVGADFSSFSAYWNYYDPNSDSYDPNNRVEIGSFDFEGSDFSRSGADVPPYTPYSLSIFASITHEDAPFSSSDLQIDPVPEPGTILLLGAGLIGLGYLGRKKKLV